MKIYILLYHEDCETTTIVRAFTGKRKLNRFVKDMMIDLDNKEYFKYHTVEECELD